MAVRDIVVWPDARLREATQDITEITEDVRTLYRDLAATMIAYKGVGIAAPQIGVPLRMFLVDAEVVGRPEGEPPVAFINPELVWKSDERERAEEGCLSFPGIYVTIERPAKARVRAMGIDGEMFETEGDELLARALQHEYDHLTGKLFIDFVGPLKKKMIRRKLKREAEAGSTGRAAIS